MSEMGSMTMGISERGVDRGVRSGSEIMIREMIDAGEEVTRDEIEVVVDMMTEIEIEEEMIITDGGEHALQACSGVRRQLAWDRGIGLMFFNEIIYPQFSMPSASRQSSKFPTHVQCRLFDPPAEQSSKYKCAAKMQ